MKAAWSLVAGLVLVFAVTLTVQAQEKKEEGKKVTLKGTLVCAKCTLKADNVTGCTTALQVKEKDKTVTYYLKDKGRAEAYHKGICPPGSKANATVTGVVTEKDGQKWITDAKVTLAKKKG